MAATRFNGPFKKAVIAAGLDPSRVVVHTLRHTALTRFAEVEQNPKTFMRFSGHRSLAAAMRYIHPSREHILSRLDQMEAEQNKVVKLQSA
jgi:integrase